MTKPMDTLVAVKCIEPSDGDRVNKTLHSTTSFRDNNSSSDVCLADDSNTGFGGSNDDNILLDPKYFVTPKNWIDHALRKNCLVCARAFSIIRKKHTCRMCGEVVCNRCSMHKRVDLPVNDNRFRVCSCCFFTYRKKYKDNVLLYTQTSAASSAALLSSTSLPQIAAYPTIVNGVHHPLTTAFAIPVPLLATQYALNSDIQSNNLSPTSSTSSSERPTFDEHVEITSAYRVAEEAVDIARREEEARLEAIRAKEIVAAKAMTLELEVERSRLRVEELELKINEQTANNQDLSQDQEKELQAARELISTLQQQLQSQQLEMKRKAAQIQQANAHDDASLSSNANDNSNDSIATELRRKLMKMERQLQQAGINVAEDIPYEEAKEKVTEISKRLQEIGSAEIVLENKELQAKLRKEYFVLEQEMEKYNTALIMTDEYVEQEKQRELQWNRDQLKANIQSLQMVRVCIPVDISIMSEQMLKDLSVASSPASKDPSKQDAKPSVHREPAASTTDSSPHTIAAVEIQQGADPIQAKVPFPPELARKLKRTNILELIRTDPESIKRMHPSVIESYRLTGLSLMERRALHLVLYEPFLSWKQQQKEEFAGRKYAWYKNMYDALVTLVAQYQQHCDQFGHLSVLHSCGLFGMQCPVVAEKKLTKVYANSLGFPESAKYFIREIIKSDPDGVGEKALAEAKSHAKAMVADQRAKSLKFHYKNSIRLATQAAGVMDDIDASLEHLQTIDASFVKKYLCEKGCHADTTVEGSTELANEETAIQSLLQEVKDLILLLAKRTGIHLVGKRDPSKDTSDSRALIEAQLSTDAISYVALLLQDVAARIETKREGFPNRSRIVVLMKSIEDLINEIECRDNQILAHEKYQTNMKRVTWDENVKKIHLETGTLQAPAPPKMPLVRSVTDDGNPLSRPVKLPAGNSSFLQAIKARKLAQERSAEPSEAPVSKPSSCNTISSGNDCGKKAPMDMLAAIKARRFSRNNMSSPNILSA